ncbi:MAG: hypothetical protein ACREJC_05745 [Tepidisphaeraceae bacterium]
MRMRRHSASVHPKPREFLDYGVGQPTTRWQRYLEARRHRATLREGQVRGVGAIVGLVVAGIVLAVVNAKGDEWWAWIALLVGASLGQIVDSLFVYKSWRPHRTSTYV